MEKENENEIFEVDTQRELAVTEFMASINE